MHRKQLLSLISSYRAIHPEESDTVDRFLSFIEQHQDCFHRTLEKGHITGSAWLVNRDQTKVLLTHHRKLNKWLQLGGHADGEADLLSVAMQEAREESGLDHIMPVHQEIFDLDIHCIPRRRKAEAHVHYDVRFALQAMSSEPFQVSDESHDLAWADIKALEGYVSETSMLRMQRKWLMRNHPA